MTVSHSTKRKRRQRRLHLQYLDRFYLDLSTFTWTNSSAVAYVLRHKDHQVLMDYTPASRPEAIKVLARRMDAMWKGNDVYYSIWLEKVQNAVYCLERGIRLRPYQQEAMQMLLKHPKREYVTY